MQHIQSTQHPIVKHLVKLREKRAYRQECHSALICGPKLIKELSLEHRFRTVLVEEGYALDFPLKAERQVTVSTSILKKVTGLVQPEPLAAEIKLPEEHDVRDASYLLILDGISDPGNMGTLLRTALALGWQGVLITPGSTDPFNEKALRAAKGATFKIPLKQASHEELEMFLATSQHMLLAADFHGTPMDMLSTRAPIALALGNEANGLSLSIATKAQRITIPMENTMESLNVASAGAILMQFLKNR
jgi:TrmH family RNA methyltransferase